MEYSTAEESEEEVEVAEVVREVAGEVDEGVDRYVAWSAASNNRLAASESLERASVCDASVALRAAARAI